MHLQQPSICHSSKFIQGTNNQLSFRLMKLSPPKKLITIQKISKSCLKISSLTARRILPVDKDLDFGPFVMNPFLFFSHCKTKEPNLIQKSQTIRYRMCTNPLYQIVLICVLHLVHKSIQCDKKYINMINTTHLNVFIFEPHTGFSSVSA